MFIIMGNRLNDAIEDQHLKALVEKNLRQSVREMSQAIGVSISTISGHLKKTSKVKKLDKWVLHKFSESQRAQGLQMCLRLFLQNRNDPFLDWIVTWQKKWILCDNH